MYHGDLHIGNVLLTDKKKFVFIDFERCTPHTAFIDPAERLLLCFLEKMYLLRYFFEITSSTHIALHKQVHDLFVKYFAEELKALRVDHNWTTLFCTILRETTATDENYSDFNFAKKVALNSLFHTELFNYNGKLYVFHQYLLARRFKMYIFE
jgi:thiamine kinase-like enzyme